MPNLVTHTPSTEAVHIRVVGLGGAAESIEAIQQFLRALTAEPGSAFVVVVSGELDDDRVASLRSSSTLPFHVVAEPTELEVNHVYVASPGHTLRADGRTLVSKANRADDRQLPVDRFFRSLARADVEPVGLVLSGPGTDGSVGLQSIVEAGGLVGAQDPTEAEPNDMPRNAIETTQVDFVQPVAALAQRAAALGDVYSSVSGPAADGLSDSQRAVLTALFEHVRTETGHDFTGYKRTTMLRRISRRMRVHRVPTLEEYLRVVRNRSGESVALQKDLLIGVTQFFRNPDAFQALRDGVLNELLSTKGARDPVRVWVPGCATGEEAYSVALLLREQAEQARMDPDRIEVFATDVDEEALGTARRGRYPEAVAADIPESYLRRYFQPDGAELVVQEAIRDRVLFAPHNVLGDPPFVDLDLVSCRNLLIYLRRSLQKKALELFHFGLREDGHLFLGTSETADPAGNDYRPVSEAHGLYQRRSVKKSVLRLPSISPRNRPDRVQARTIGPSVEALHRRMLEAYAPASVLVGDQFDVVHLSSSVSRYLQHPPGPPNTNVLELVRPELCELLRSALEAAFDEQAPVETSAVEVSIDGERRFVELEVRPAGALPEVEGMALVLFREDDPSGAAGADRETVDVRSRDLASELQRTRRELWTARIQHDSSRQAMQTANEKLRSMSEEYRSMGEEMAEANRELKALNEALEEKVEALQTATDDLENLVTATEAGALFLDRDLCVQRYTDRVSSLLALEPSDTGRPVDDLSHRLDYDRLWADADAVLDTLTPVEREVRTDTDEWVLVRHYPYRTAEERIVGVVVTFLNITERKEAEAERQAAYEALQDRTEQVEALAEALTAAEQRERDRLSRLLHDNLQQMIYAARIKVETLSDQSSFGEKQEDLAARAVELLEESVEVTRSLSSELSPPVGDRSILDLVEWLAIRMQESYGLAVAIQSRGNVQVTDATSRTLLFRVVRELLFNVVKHAGVEEAQLRVEGDEERLRVEVEDEGQGFDAAGALDRAQGMGLGNVFDRIEMVGGTVSIDAAPGEGTRVTVSLPRAGLGGDRAPSA